MSNLVTLPAPNQTQIYKIESAGPQAGQVVPVVALDDETIASISGGSSTTPSNARNPSGAYVSNIVAKVSAGQLIGATIFSSKSGPQFIQFHDAAALPSDGAVPELIVQIPANGTYTLYFGNVGRKFSNGIVVTNSSTGPTKTIGSADCWFDIQYL